MNLIVLQGRLGRDPEIKKMNNGNNLCKFPLAVTNSRKKNEKGYYETDWFNCTAFGKTCELIEKYFSKGKGIIINGQINMNRYQDRSGQDQTTYEVIVSNISFPVQEKKQAQKNETPEERKAKHEAMEQEQLKDRDKRIDPKTVTANKDFTVDDIPF